MIARLIANVGTLVALLALGIAVCLTNRKRVANQQFLAFCAVSALWLLAIGLALAAPTAAQAGRFVRLASTTAPLILAMIDGLRLAILHPERSWRRIMAQLKGWWLCSTLIAILCQTRLFFSSIALPDGRETGYVVPEPVYGPGNILYVAYIVLAAAVVVRLFVRDIGRSSGIQRAELQFTLLGCMVGVAFGGMCVLIMPALLGTSETVQFAFVSAIILAITIAYGIATRRILSVAVVLSRSTGYLLLAAYLGLLYFAVWRATLFAGGLVGSDPRALAHVLAAFAIAFSLAPAQGWMQRVAHLLYLGGARPDLSTTLQEAARALREIGTLDALLERFLRIVARAAGTSRVAVLLRNDDHFETRTALPPGEEPLRLARGSPIIHALRSRPEPITADGVLRLPPDSHLHAAGRALAELQLDVAVGIGAKGELAGLMLLGPRQSGQIYGANEQDALQLLCDQLAVAIENAKLYTELQNSKLYNDLLVDNLACGLVACNPEKVVTVFNREAQRITGLSPAEALGHPIDRLPARLPRVLASAVDSRQGTRNLEMRIRNAQGREVPIQVSTSFVYGHEGKALGALLLMSDLTAIKQLQMQVQRTDRLASIGTLAAGMAHEIKNPLVSIKTFTQILPERYEDPEFRETFVPLLAEEVKHIDRVVTQLLDFARPAKPSLSPSRLHEILNHALRLVQQQLRQQQVELVRAFEASTDRIDADADLLNQAFVNFFLNAVESMPDGGTLRVATRVVDSLEHADETPVTRRVVSVSIDDTGPGIPAGDLPRLFDPFFTTKSNGTGLGLSVAHGIIQEHGGTVDVESREGRGTRFRIALPLRGEEGRTA